MTAPAVSVGIGLGVPEAGDFVIGDTTRGVIGSTDFTVASGYTAVTADGYSVSIRRGRWSRLWDSFEAGRASVSVWNRDRAYDPSYLASDYNGYIVPGRPLRVKAGDVTIWTGQVDDIDLGYEVDGQSSATFVATDVLGRLGAMQFDAWTSSGVNAATKLAAICDRSEVGVSSAVRVFDEGVELLQSDAVSWGSSVNNYAQLVARSDLGWLFGSADGTLTFRNRLATSGVAAAVSFGDDGVGIPFARIEATIGSELLFARVSVDREGGTAQTATVADVDAWQAKYGSIRSLSIGGLLLGSDAQSLALAEYILSLYDTPRYRVSQLVIDLHALSGADQLSVLGLDIGSVVDVTFTPNGVGDPIVQTLVIQGIGHDISVDRHSATFSVIDVPLPYFRIGDSVLGVIGAAAGNRLGF